MARAPTHFSLKKSRFLEWVPRDYEQALKSEKIRVPKRKTISFMSVEVLA